MLFLAEDTHAQLPPTFLIYSRPIFSLFLAAIISGRMVIHRSVVNLDARGLSILLYDSSPNLEPI
jgi:hypothetical protein